MGFSLTISEGKDRGREYTFSQPEVCIGRTAENDLVLTEPGVSRRHVKIREEGGAFFVEDLGSANGTKVNGEAVTENELADGDSIQVGPVVFAFTAVPDAGENSTRIFDPAELERKMLATKKAKEAAAAQAGGQKRAVTSMAQAIPRQPSGPRNAASARGNSGSKALAPAGKSAPAVAPKGGPLAKKAPAAPPKSASERARERRQASTPIARFKLWWSEAPKPARFGVAGGGGLVVLVLLFLVFRGGGSVASNMNLGDGSKKLYDIGSEPSQDTWGYGMDGVQNQTYDKAQFQFLFPVTAKKAIATLHFSSAGVQKAEWVDVAVNTIHVGFVEPSFGDQVKDQEISIPTKYLQPNKRNRVVFDHLKNPPGHEPWLLARVWVDVQQLPEDTPDNLKRRAQAAIDNGDHSWEFRQIGAENTFKAWKEYRQAQLYLEALDEHTDQLDIVRQKIKDATRELDSICAKYMLKGQAAEQQHHASEAIAIYKGALAFFPDKDHPCFQQLHDKLQNLE